MTYSHSDLLRSAVSSRVGGSAQTMCSNRERPTWLAALGVRRETVILGLEHLTLETQCCCSDKTALSAIASLFPFFFFSVRPKLWVNTRACRYLNHRALKLGGLAVVQSERSHLWWIKRRHIKRIISCKAAARAGRPSLFGKPPHRVGETSMSQIGKEMWIEEMAF